MLAERSVSVRSIFGDCGCAWKDSSAEATNHVAIFTFIEVSAPSLGDASDERRGFAVFAEWRTVVFLRWRGPLARVANLKQLRLQGKLAEREGFEPSMGF